MKYKLTMRSRDLTLRHYNPYGINTVFCYAIEIPRSEIYKDHNWADLQMDLRATMGPAYLLGSTRPGRNRRYAVVRALGAVVRLQFRKDRDRTLILMKNG